MEIPSAEQCEHHQACPTEREKHFDVDVEQLLDGVDIGAALLLLSQRPSCQCY